MANALKHKFTSTKSDGADTTKVRPTNWNEEHVFAGGAEAQALVYTGAQTDKAGWGYRDRVGFTASANVGNVGTGEDTLQTYTMPANTMIANGNAVRVRGWGITAGNANVKTIKFKFGATSVTLNTTAAPNGLPWSFEATIVRTGAATQTMLVRSIVNITVEVHAVSTPTETLSGAVIIRCTGEAVADNDIVQNAMIVEHLDH